MTIPGQIYIYIWEEFQQFIVKPIYLQSMLSLVKMVVLLK